MKATFRQSLSWSTQYDFLMVLPLQYPFWLKFWHIEGNVWVLLTQKGLNMKQWNGCVNWKGEKIQTNPHWFDFHGPPTHSQWSTLVSFSYKKTIKNKSKQPQLLRSRGSRDYFTPDEEEQREKKEKETGREKRGWTISLSRVSSDPRVSQDSFVLLCWGEVQLHGLVDFPVLLAHQLQGEGAVQDLWGGKETLSCWWNVRMTRL